MEEAMKGMVKEGMIEAFKDITEIAVAINGKDPYELLTAEQLYEETGIPPNNIRDLFKKYKNELGVQTYTVPYKVQRINWYRFTSVGR